MENELLETIFGGGAVAISLLLVPKFALKRLGSIVLPELGSFRPFAPNWLTAYSIVITLWGFQVYRTHTALGVAIAVFGAMLDRLDGKMALSLGQTLSPPSEWTVGLLGHLFAKITTWEIKTEEGEPIVSRFRKGSSLFAILRRVSLPYREPKRSKRITLVPSESSRGISRCSCWLHRWWAEFNFPGGTDLGKVFDPFGDKLKSLIILFAMAQQGLLSPWIVGILVIPELAGTVIRRPFYYFQRFTQDSKATAVGKYKVIFQWITIILCIPYQKHWIDLGHWAYGLEWTLNWLLGFTIFLAFASIASRFKWVRQRREVKEVMKTLESSTEHE